MKLPNSPLLISLLLLVFSCHTRSKDSSAQEDTPADEMMIMIPGQTCYLGTVSRDSIFLKTELFPDVVTGTLEYRNYEKDRSSGVIDGKMNGDTLLAEYTFMSEGLESVAQVIFLIKGDTAVEGFGEMEEKEGKMVFKDLSKISFDQSVKLNKTACHE